MAGAPRGRSPVATAEAVPTAGFPCPGGTRSLLTIRRAALEPGKRTTFFAKSRAFAACLASHAFRFAHPTQGIRAYLLGGICEGRGRARPWRHGQNLPRVRTNRLRPSERLRDARAEGRARRRDYLAGRSVRRSGGAERPR